MKNYEDEDDTEETPSTAAPQPINQEIEYRYACPACTGIAFYSFIKAKDVIHSDVCQNCGIPVGEINVDNFIQLTDEEKERLRINS